MARQTNGTDQSLQSASTVDLTAYTKIAIFQHLWWDTFANDDDLAYEFGDGTGDRMFLNPNGSAFGGNISYFNHNNGGDCIRSWVRPSANAWHRMIVNLDIAQVGAAEIVSVYIDAASQALTNRATFDNTGTYNNRTLNLMSRNNTTLFGAGRIAEFAIYGGINLSGTDATNLETLRPDQVQSGSLIHYWKLCGLDSPETASIGGINLTVNGATFIDHPLAGSCSTTITGLGRSMRTMTPQLVGNPFR
jgi:hypothetical protein